MILAGGFILSLIVLHFFYWYVAVPFHYWMAKKMNATYDPRTNRYIINGDPK